MATTTNYNWTTPDDSALVKDGASAIRSLGTAIDSTVFTNAGAAVTKATVDAKGDLIAGTADNTIARLAVGANDTILTADSSTATGLKWAAPAVAGGMTLISETVASSLSSLSLSSIPGTYKQLILEWDGIEHSDSSTRFNVRFNNVSTSSYAFNAWIITGNTAENAGNVTTTAGGDAMVLFGHNTGGVALRQTARGYMIIDDYASTTKLKAYNVVNGYTNVSVGDRGGNIIGTFDSTSAITSIDVVRSSGTGTFSNKTNTSIRLYGLS